MTIPAQIPVTSSVANGVTTTFPYTFKILDAADLSVSVDGVIVTTGFTVNGVGEDNGGNVVFDTSPTNGKKIVRYLDPEFDRETDYQQFGDWIAEIVNGDFDRIWLALQFINQSQVRAIKLPVDVIANQNITEDAAERANTVISFDDDGNVKLKNAQELIPEFDAAVNDAIAASASAQSSASSANESAIAAATTPVAAPTHAAASKTTPVGLDELPLIDSAASFGLKRLTWANLKATLKTYFDTLYSLVVVNATNDPTFASTSSTNAVSAQWVKGLIGTGAFDNLQVFNSSGTFTVPVGVTKCKVLVVAAGGNGGNSQGGGTGGQGGLGGAASKLVTGLTPLSTISVTVGASNSQSSSFGVHVSATGGGTGGASTGGTDGGNGGNGVGAGGDLNYYNNINLGVAAGQVGPNSNGANGIGIGSGGSGGNSSAAGGSTRIGGAGGPGVVIVEW